MPSQEPHLVPADPPLLSAPSPELVLFVGYPALGKSSFFRTHFAPAGYTHVNQDTLKTRDKCVKAVGQALQEKQSVVVGGRILYAMRPGYSFAGRRQHEP